MSPVFAEHDGVTASLYYGVCAELTGKHASVSCSELGQLGRPLAAFFPPPLLSCGWEYYSHRSGTAPAPRYSL